MSVDWREEADLSARSTLGVPSTARALAVVRDEADCLRALERAAAEQLPVQLLGDGSNVVLAPRIEGLVLSFSPEPVPRLGPGVARIGAGVSWDAFVRACAGQGLWCLENLALIPGRVGAAPIQNIGAYGQEFADRCVAVHLIDRARGAASVLAAQECGFGYRSSCFRDAPERWVVTGVELSLTERGSPVLDYPALADSLAGRTPSSPAELVEAVTALRRARLPDPVDAPNAGSFFKNPVVSAARFAALGERYDLPGHVQPDGQVKLSAAWLIERAGWRGREDGGVAMAERHALVLVRVGEVDGEAVLDFARRVAEDVEARFGVRLEPEPLAIGFD